MPPGQQQTFGRGGGRSSVSTRGGGAHRGSGFGEQCDEFGRAPNPSAFGGGFGRGGGVIGAERGRVHEMESEQGRDGVVDQWWPKGMYLHHNHNMITKTLKLFSLFH